MWGKYFNLVKLCRGPVVIPGFGKVDFRRQDLPVETIQKLWEADFEYLEITPFGKKELYGAEDRPLKVEENTASKRKHTRKKTNREEN